MPSVIFVLNPVELAFAGIVIVIYALAFAYFGVRLCMKKLGL